MSWRDDHLWLAVKIGNLVVATPDCSATPLLRLILTQIYQRCWSAVGFHFCAPIKVGALWPQNGCRLLVAAGAIARAFMLNVSSDALQDHHVFCIFSEATHV